MRDLIEKFSVIHYWYPTFATLFLEVGALGKVLM